MTAWKDTKDVRIKKRGGRYWARFMRQGKMIQKSLGTGSFEIAKRQVENIESDLQLGVDWRRESERFETAWPDFLIDKANGVKTKKARPNTLRGYVGFGELYYQPYFNDKKLSQITEDEWVLFVAWVKTQKPDMHFDNVRKYLMGFLSWAYRKGKIRKKPELVDPDIERKENREEDGPGLAYSTRQLEIMRELAQSQSPQFFLFMLMCQYMGMRPGEITQLKRDRVDLSGRVIRLRKADTKTATARVVPIHPQVLLRLEHQLSRAEGSPYVFPNRIDSQRPMDPTGFKNAWKEVTAHPEIEGRIYDFRHTFITNAIAQGMNPAAVAKITGTSLRMIEKRYLHFTPEQLNAELSRFAL
jgi:integrase